MANSNVIYSDVDPFLRLDGQGRIKILVNEEAVISSVQTIVKTVFGQRPWLYDFANASVGYLFDLNTNAVPAEVQNDLLKAIRKHDPRPEIQSMLFSTDREKGLLYIDLSMTIKGLKGIFTTQIII